MPPHLHPRSTATSTLFAGTLLASFVVVAIPHLVPCPRPHGRGQLNSEIQVDENGKPIRRVRRTATKPDVEASGSQTSPSNVAAMKSSTPLSKEAAMFQQLQQEAEVLKAEASKDRECPVPKPKGVLGRWLGLEGGARAEAVKD